MADKITSIADLREVARFELEDLEESQREEARKKATDIIANKKHALKTGSDSSFVRSVIESDMSKEDKDLLLKVHRFDSDKERLKNSKSDFQRKVNKSEKRRSKERVIEAIEK